MSGVQEERDRQEETDATEGQMLELTDVETDFWNGEFCVFLIARTTRLGSNVRELNAPLLEQSTFDQMSDYLFTSDRNRNDALASLIWVPFFLSAAPR
jgi:hypothetical protein